MVHRPRLQPVLRVVLAAAVMTVGVAACGGDDSGGTGPEDISAFAPDLIPAQVLGLDVAGARNTYLDQVSLYSFRADDLLQATLEVARFTESAQVEDPDFRRNIANQVGNALPRELQMGNQTVFVTAGTRQGLAVWFLDDHMFVLATRDDFEQPRALLRALLEVSP
jgi:hypothetical protein